MSEWHTSVIQKGDQTGRRFVYPTINLDPAVLDDDTERGVYASWVKLDGETYQGALYFGPRLVKDEEHDVLEIYLLDFASDEEVYSKEAAFALEDFIRGVEDFPDLETLRKQIDQDITAVKEVLSAKA